jgi:hypothetical protein
MSVLEVVWPTETLVEEGTLKRGLRFFQSLRPSVLEHIFPHLVETAYVRCNVTFKYVVSRRDFL